MMSSSSWPGWLGSRCAIASASLTRREINGISSTLAFIAATVNRPTKRCSIARTAGAVADHHNVRIGAVPQVTGHGGLRKHQQVVGSRSAAASRSRRSRSTPSRLDGSTEDCAVAHRAALVTEQHEVSVGQPAQQRGHILAVGAGEPDCVGVEFGGQATQRRRHRGRVERRPAARRRARRAAAARPRPAPCGRPSWPAGRGSRSSSMPVADRRVRRRLAVSSRPPGRGAPGTPGS